MDHRPAGLRSSGRLPRIEEGHVIELGLAHPRDQHSHELVLALTRGVSLHRRDEILRVLPGETRHSGPRADPILAVTPRAGDGFVSRSALVAPDHVGEKLRVLAGKARPAGIDGDALRAMAAGTRGRGRPSGRRVANRRSLRPSGGLPRIVKRNVVELGLTHARENQPHEVVLALTRDVRLHRRDGILRVLSDQAWDFRLAADPALAVTGGATDRPHVRRGWAMAAFAVELAFVGGPVDFGPSASSRTSCIGRMAGQTRIRAEKMRVDRRSPVHRRGCGLWWTWRRCASRGAWAAGGAPAGGLVVSDGAESGVALSFAGSHAAPRRHCRPLPLAAAACLLDQNPDLRFAARSRAMPQGQDPGNEKRRLHR